MGTTERRLPGKKGGAQDDPAAVSADMLTDEVLTPDDDEDLDLDASGLLDAGEQ